MPSAKPLEKSGKGRMVVLESGNSDIENQFIQASRTKPGYMLNIFL